MEENKQLNNNTGLVVLVTILFMLVLGLGGFIMYDKFIKQDESKENNIQIKEKETFVESTDCYKNNFDTTKAINGVKDEKYSLEESELATDSVVGYARIKENRKLIELNIRWEDFGQYVGINSTEFKDYDISFNKNIKSILFGGSGQDPSYQSLYVLMEDGTVEYVPIWKIFKDSKDINTVVKSYGAIEGVRDIIKLENGTTVSTCNNCVGGGVVTFAIKADGSFYILPYITMK